MDDSHAQKSKMHRLIIAAKAVEESMHSISLPMSLRGVKATTIDQRELNERCAQRALLRTIERNFAIFEFLT